MTENVFEQILNDILVLQENGPIEYVENFKNEGLPTNDKGLLIRTDDNSEFVITIIKRN